MYLFQDATNRLEYSLPAKSCEGDPAPILAPAAALPNALGPFPAGTGKRPEAPEAEGVSLGEVVPVEEAPERGGCGLCCGR
jgi:hypothetical protein